MIITDTTDTREITQALRLHVTRVECDDCDGGATAFGCWTCNGAGYLTGRQARRAQPQPQLRRSRLRFDFSEAA